MTKQQLKLEHNGALLIIQLDRPEALNALSLELLNELKRVLIDAFADDQVKTIWLESASERAFCAGGDVKALTLALDEHSLALEKANVGRRYFEIEYALDLLIEQSLKPIVTFSHGITFGGGWGLYAGGNLKLATEAARFAMPENQIGLFPDVGAAHFLQQPNWKMGTFVGLGGFTLSAAEAMALDYVDDIISLEYAAILKQQLANGLEITELDIQSANPEIDGLYQHWTEAVDLLDDDGTLTDWISIAEQNPSFEPFKRAIHAWESASAWSLALTWTYFSQSRDKSRAEVLSSDLNVASYCCTHEDLNEGVHAKLIAKNRTPEWKYPHVESVAFADIMQAIDFNNSKNEE